MTTKQMVDINGKGDTFNIPFSKDVYATIVMNRKGMYTLSNISFSIIPSIEVIDVLVYAMQSDWPGFLTNLNNPECIAFTKTSIV